MSGKPDEPSSLVDGFAAVDLPGEEEVRQGQSLLSRISTEVVQTFTADVASPALSQ